MKTRFFRAGWTSSVLAAIPLALILPLHSQEALDRDEPSGATASVDELRVVIPAKPIAELAKDRWRAHYQRVADQLAAVDVSTWSEEDALARAKTIQALRDYRAKGDFPINTTDVPGRRRMFRDEGGRLCAVATLIDHWGEDELLDRLAAENNHAFLLELRGDVEFDQWLDSCGLTLEEAARIHGPAFGGGRPAYGGPGDTVGTGPSGPGSPGPTSPGSPGSPGGRPGVPGPSSPKSPGIPRPVGPQPPSGPMTPAAVAVVDVHDWMRWWEYNKLAWMPTHRLAWNSAPMSGADAALSARARAQEVRERAIEAFIEAAQHEDAGVRGAAAIALGRLTDESGRIEEIAPLLHGLLEDPVLSVRRQTILGLGASEPMASMPKLLNSVRSVKHGLGAQPLAVLAMALASLQSDAALFAPLCPQVISHAQREVTTEIGAGLAMAYSLESSRELDNFVMRASGLVEGFEAHGDVLTHARALEVVAREGTDELLPRVLAMLGNPRTVIRRSAAAAMGNFREPLALQPMLTAYELETDAVCRGLILLSVARHDLDEARKFLQEELKGGQHVIRAWAAIALGINADEFERPELSKAIRHAFSKERNMERRGAYLLAGAIAGDTSLASVLRREVLSASSPETRGVAAQACAVLGGEKPRRAILDALKREKNELAKAKFLQALASFGDARDVKVLRDELLEFSNPDLSAVVASALGTHGTPQALDTLFELLADEETEAAARAMVVQSIGMMLDDDDPFLLCELSKGANFTAFPDWLNEALRSTL